MGTRQSTRQTRGNAADEASCSASIAKLRKKVWKSLEAEERTSLLRIHKSVLGLPERSYLGFDQWKWVPEA